MRPCFLLPLLLLPACEAAVPLTAGLGVAHVASVTIIGRTLPDAAVSLVSGRECSSVRLERGLSYCRTEELPPEPPPYCTRSLGRVDCWRSPPLAVPRQVGVADGRTSLTALQEAHRTRRWGDLFWDHPDPAETARPVAAPAAVAMPVLEPIAAPRARGEMVGSPAP
ncbi:hypothetical protein JYK14_20785 [Siccirubricoccus sp. KC 17139]|uniref:Lipoprotein n=1 Tax=Siccirubricoccus soli TaxID=2899147 RepID=A0ABT1D9K1_9PROT|nr:hypothetical protein [Siccirubricoccus soli]MCO6418576.1 hypothetical protein [Siccirubricoccus soli]MCP2684711.1 hypothetical protein [Siccirubricoccus soli]